jgi:hypothetical protein
MTSQKKQVQKRAQYHSFLISVMNLRFHVQIVIEKLKGLIHDCVTRTLYMCVSVCDYVIASCKLEALTKSTII